ncbi:hypothetical protein BDR05DRAFT_891223 [Suillus weaverae]|nr:hypothetical protein BDR05DRAFT_891223 [Suillus weaverae]
MLSLQEDFATKKPMIQHYIESCGHVCMFLSKFHCKLNPIELWGYAKYCYHKASDRKFTTVKVLVPQCLNMCETLNIRWFFRKTWCCMDAYRKGLDSRQTAFTVHKYKSHRHVGLPNKIIALMEP